MRRNFLLPEVDQVFVDASNFEWETISDGNGQWLLVHSYPVPPGFNHSSVLVALMIPPGYPVVQLDMAYFFPHLARTDNKAIPAITFQGIDGKSFQRWSRHRTGENPWRPGIDDVSTHLAMISSWFEKELKR